MGFLGYLLQHIIELVSTVILAIGVYFVFQIKNQKSSINNSPGSQQVNIQGNVTNSQFNSFKEDIKKEVVLSEESPEKESNPRKLVTKLDNSLDENKPVSTLANISLRLANELKMSEDIEWLSKEVNGFHDVPKESYKEGLKFQKAKESDRHRSIIAELNIEFKNGKLDSLSIPMFISQSLYDIENWISQISKASNQAILVLNAPPPQLMVEQLKVNPDERLPYIISRSSLDKIISGARSKVIEFLDRAKKAVK